MNKSIFIFLMVLLLLCSIALVVSCRHAGGHNQHHVRYRVSQIKYVPPPQMNEYNYIPPASHSNDLYGVYDSANDNNIMDLIVNK